MKFSSENTPFGQSYIWSFPKPSTMFWWQLFQLISRYLHSKAAKSVFPRWCPHLKCLEMGKVNLEIDDKIHQNQITVYKSQIQYLPTCFSIFSFFLSCFPIFVFYLKLQSICWNSPANCYCLFIKKVARKNTQRNWISARRMRIY